MAGSEVNSLKVDAEINKLKLDHGKKISVIRDIGDYKFVLSFKIHTNLTIKFQLSDKYPEVEPEIILRSELHQCDQDSLLEQLKTKSTSCRGSVMINDLVSIATEFLDKHGNIPEYEIADNSRSSPRQPYKDKKSKKKKKDKDKTDKIIVEKLPSMKTASDVISRILWDADLPTDEFIVGYIDRFTGLQEKPFTAFSWEDLASVDYTVLAIPKHRIEYFKYKDLKVWDKALRMDNVFGSAGSGKTIDQVIEAYETKLAEQSHPAEDDDGEIIGNHDNRDVAIGNHGNRDVVIGNHGNIDEHDSDSDDDIEINIGSNEYMGSGSSVNNRSSGEGVHESVDSEDETSEDQYWRDKLRPNHFIAIRITDPLVCQTMQHIQDVISDREERYQECCIPEKSLHMTLCTLGLDTYSHIIDAVQCLRDNEADLAALASKIKLKINGVTNFYDRVLYAKVDYSQELKDLYDYLKLVLQTAGLEIRDSHDFVPHITIMKVSRPVAKVMGNGKISPFVCDGCEEIDFGEQNVDGIHLCSMAKDRRPDGFYMTPVSLNFS